MKRWLNTMMLLLAVLMGGSWSRSAAHEPGRPDLPVANQARQAAILAATVRIQLIAPKLDEAGQPLFLEHASGIQQQLVFDDGLGTVVSSGRRRLVVTHNHWRLLTPELWQVRIYDSDRHCLAILSGRVFHNLIVWQEGGTLVFLAPEGVGPGMKSSESGMPAAGDRVLLVHLEQPGGELELLSAEVTRIEAGVLHLHLGQEVTILPGSSGGGVWLANGLAGNLWSVVYMDHFQGCTCVGSTVIESRAAPLPAWLASA